MVAIGNKTCDGQRRKDLFTSTVFIDLSVCVVWVCVCGGGGVKGMVSPDLVMVCHLAGHLVGRATSPAIPMPRMPRFALFSGRVHVMLQVGPMCKGTLSLCVF
jgi:hypothetical protein